MRISVLIATYNRRHQLPATLAPLLADPATGEVVVVDDGSDDGSFALLQRMAVEEPRLRPFHIENRGTAGAWQFALERAECDVVLSIDDDVEAHDGLVSGHARAHETSPNRVVVGYMPTVRRPRNPGSFVIDGYADEYERVCAMWERDAVPILRRLWAGNISMPRQALLAAGGCDAGAGLRYSHDQELGLRLSALGLDASFDRRLRADHHLERSVAGYFRAARLQGHDLVIIARLHPGQASFPRWRDSGPGAWLRRLALRPRGYVAIARLGLWGLSTAGRLHLWELERRIGRFLESVEMLQGMLDERRGAGRGASQDSPLGEVTEGSEPVWREPVAPIG